MSTIRNQDTRVVSNKTDRTGRPDAVAAIIVPATVVAAVLMPFAIPVIALGGAVALANCGKGAQEAA